MDFISVNDPELLESLLGEMHGSPEQLLEELEEALENGELSVNEVIDYLTDLNARN